MNHHNGTYPNDFAGLDDFGKGAAPERQFKPSLETVANGDYDVLVEEATLDRVHADSVVRLALRLTSAGGRQVEHLYWLNRQESVNAFLAEMASLGFPAAQWGSGPGKLPLSRAIPDCVANLRGVRFRATKSSRFVPSQPGGLGRQAREARTYHDLHISGRIGGAPMPPTIQPPAPETPMAPAGAPDGDIPF